MSCGKHKLHVSTNWVSDTQCDRSSHTLGIVHHHYEPDLEALQSPGLSQAKPYTESPETG